MIIKKTVLILGAGASMPLGFPSGRDLKTAIINNLADADFANKLSSLTSRSREDVTEFAKALAASPLYSVDAFLEHRKKDFLDLGKYSIASTILHFERESIGKEYDWFNYFYNLWVSGLKKNSFDNSPLTVLTYNYDRSFEYFLFNALRSTYGLGDDEAAEMTKSIPIRHIHGDVGSLREFSPPGIPRVISLSYGEESPTLLSEAYKRIRIVHEEIDQDMLRQAHRSLHDAEQVIILGFGYQEQNCRRLQLDTLDTRKKQVFCCFKGMKAGEQSRAAQFLPSGHIVGSENLDGLNFLRNFAVL